MNQIIRPELLPQRAGTDDDSFIGYRYVRRQGPDGTDIYDEVPLTEEDLLYPEEGDWIVQKPPHSRDFGYCMFNLRGFFKQRGDSSVVVLGDNRVDFGVRGLQPLGPDILVLFDVPEWRQPGTYQLRVDGGSPVLAIEITSPTTRKADVGPKVDLYHRAGIPLYVIVDRGPRGDRAARIIGRRRTPAGWEMLDLDARGRLSLDPVPLEIGIEDNLTWLYDIATGERLPDPEDFQRDREAMRAQIEGEVKARKKAEASTKRAQARAKKAEAKVKEEAEAREELEKRIRELEKQLRRRKGKS
jgi:Uma2 family endonuclease